MFCVDVCEWCVCFVCVSGVSVLCVCEWCVCVCFVCVCEWCVCVCEWYVWCVCVSVVCVCVYGQSEPYNDLLNITFVLAFLDLSCTGKRCEISISERITRFV